MLDEVEIEKQKIEYYKERFILDQYNHIRNKSSPIIVEYHEDGTFKLI